MATIRFGLVGTGPWARDCHGPALAGHPGVELVGVWGRDAAKRRTTAALLGARAVGDYDELVDAVDALAFAVPPDVQARLARTAAARGRHLLLDKPVALDPVEARRLAVAAERGRVGVVTFYTARFQPGIAATLAAATGEPGWTAFVGVSLSRALADPASPYLASAWRHARGALWDLGPHLLALALPALGPVREVVLASRGTHLTQLLLAHATGATSTMLLSLTMPEGAVAARTDLYGSAGVCSLPEGTLSAVEAYGRALDELLAGVAAGRTAHPCDLRLGCEVVDVLCRAEEALSTAKAGGAA